MNLLRAVLPFLILHAAASGCAEGGVHSVGDIGFGESDTKTTPPRDAGYTPPPTDASTTPICGAGTTVCLSDTQVGECRADGLDYNTTSCTEGTTCANGACVRDNVCTPDSLECLDDRTVLRCRQTGEGYIQTTCPEGLNCGDGVCTDKLPTGAGCNADDECASQNCRCGAATDDGCPEALGGGICAPTSCPAAGCGLSGYCLAASEVPTGAADYDHCVRGCTSRNPCPNGAKCVELPVHTANGVAYESACYFPNAKGFGDTCSADAECLSGACLTDYFSEGFCSRRCEADGACAADAGCVELRPNEYWCSLLCGDGSITGTDPCPLDVPIDRFDVTCKVLSKLGVGALRACSTP